MSGITAVGALMLEIETASNSILARELRLRPEPGLLVTRQSDGTIVEMNEVMLHWIGRSRDEAIGKTTLSLGCWVNPGQREELVALLELRGHVDGFEAEFHAADGSILRMRISCCALSHARGPVIVNVVSNITTDCGDSERLELGQRLAAIGSVAAGVAHEMSNPLTYATINCESARLAAERGDWREALRAIDETREALALVSDIVRDLRSSSRADWRVADIDVRAALLAAIKLTRADVLSVARLDENVPDLPWVRGNPQRLTQVFLNLLANAAQSFHRRSSDNEIAVRGWTSGDDVIVEVRDNGQGMCAETVARLFEPFFSRRLGGGGVGLGLAISKRIVDDAGGRIEVESSPGVGSCFRVILPARPRG